MQGKTTIEVARLGVRSKICPSCYQRPPGSEALGPSVARSCEPGCTIFNSLGKLLAAMNDGPLDAAPDDIMRKVVCQSCQASPSAGDFCAEALTRTCPLSRYGGQVLQLLEELRRIPGAAPKTAVRPS